jgi:hypothetical protein
VAFPGVFYLLAVGEENPGDYPLSSGFYFEKNWSMRKIFLCIL